MKFIVEYKRPTPDDDFTWEAQFEEVNDLGDLVRAWSQRYQKEYKTLVEANQKYRDWLKSNPPSVDVEQGNIPDDIKTLIVSITKVISYLNGNIDNFIAQYPGLEKSKNLDIEGNNLSINAVWFSQTANLEVPSLDLFPEIKWVCAEFDFPIQMSDQEIAFEENNDGWYYFLRDILLSIGGMFYTCDSFTGAYKTIYRKK